VTKKSQLLPFRYFYKSNLAVVGKTFCVAERIRDDELFPGLTRLGLDLQTASG
jgi:hypothetical protein